MHMKSLHAHVISLACQSSTSSPSSDAGLHWDARLWGALVVLCGVLFLDGLDVSMVGVALPSIGSDLDLSTSSLQWVVSGYVLGYGGLLLLGGRFADLLGRRRVLLAALAVFTLASISRWPGQRRHAARRHPLPQGRGRRVHRAGQPVDHHHDLRRGSGAQPRAQHLHRLGASGFSLGLVFGGLMTELGWRWTFLLPVPVALGLLIAAPRVLAKDGPIAPGVRRSFDFAGARDAHRGHAAAGAHDRRGARHRLERPRDARRAGRGRGAADDLRRASSAAPPTRSSGSGSCAPRRWCGPTSA